MYEYYHSFFFFLFAEGETETLNLIDLPDILHTVLKDGAYFPIYLIDLRGIQILDEVFCLSVLGVFIDLKEKKNLGNTGQALCTSSLPLSPLTLSEGSGFNIALTPAFIFPLPPPLTTCWITRIQ